MTRRFRSLTASLCALALGCAPALAQETGSTSDEGALFLLLPVGAQAVSLGRAMTTMEGSESAFWNPAGLAGAQGNQFVLFRGDHAVGKATAVTGILKSDRLGALAASYLLLDVGDQDRTDDNGNVVGRVSVRNHLGVVSAAARVLDRLSAGVNFKIVQFRYSCRGLCPDAGTTATTYAVDAGVQATPLQRLRVGAMLAHLGPRLQVLNAEQADPLPARVRVALAYDVFEWLMPSDQLAGWLAVEVQDRLRDPGSLSLYLGSELSAGDEEVLSLRAGRVFSELEQEDGWRVGLGLRYERFDLSIAKSLTVSTITEETEPVHVTFSIVL